MIKRLWIKFLLLLLSVSLIALSATFLVRELMLGDFRQYLEGEREDGVYWVTAKLEGAYEKKGYWRRDIAAENAVWALMLGFETRLFDNRGNFVMDTETALRSLTPLVRNRVLSLSDLRSSEKSPSYFPYPLFLNGEEIGRLEARFLFPRRGEKFVERTNRFVLLSVVLLGGIAFVLSVIFSRKLTKPIKSLLSSTTAISEGNLKKRVEVPGRDELGRLAEAFNRMAASLENQEALRKKLVTNAAHELRTPLTAMRSELEGMLDGLIPVNEEQLRSLNEETGRLKNLIDGMEELAQARASSLNLNKEAIELRPFLRSVIDRASRTTPGLNDVISLRCDETLTVSADPDVLGRIVLNLLNNAARAVENRGTVEVRATRERGHIALAVADTGSGIRQEDLPFIFERFFHAAPGGLGLGLAIVKELAEAHGGTITVESEYGKGSVFTVRLPMP